MPFGLVYEFSDLHHNNALTYAKLTLCEDCSNALGSLHLATMKKSKPHMYSEDEIMELKA